MVASFSQIYTYDEIGNPLSCYSVSYLNGGADALAANNRITYRGYYYDSNLGMYYLQSRNYDPIICRFINADSALYHKKIITNMAK